MKRPTDKVGLNYYNYIIYRSINVMEKFDIRKGDDFYLTLKK